MWPFFDVFTVNFRVFLRVSHPAAGTGGPQSRQQAAGACRPSVSMRARMIHPTRGFDPGGEHIAMASPLRADFVSSAGQRQVETDHLSQDTPRYASSTIRDL
jgi:hypothetical protein